MSKNYKQAMDRIAVSDALKSRIMDAAEEKLTEGELEEKTDSRAQKRSKVFYLRYAAGIAACAAICLTTVYLTKNLGMDGILPQLEEPPIQSEIEPPSKNEPSADKNTENTEGNSTEKPQTAPKSDEGLTDSKNTDTTGSSDGAKGQGGNITSRPSSAAESGSGISDNSENTANNGKLDNSGNTAAARRTAKKAPQAAEQRKTVKIPHRVSCRQNRKIRWAAEIRVQTQAMSFRQRFRRQKPRILRSCADLRDMRLKCPHMLRKGTRWTAQALFWASLYR